MVKASSVTERKIIANDENRVQTGNLNTSKRYTLQIYGSYYLKDVKKMRKELMKTNHNVYYGCAKFNDRDWFVLTYGTYDSPSEARSSLTQLPDKYRNKDAFVRSTQEIQWNDCRQKDSN